MSDRVPSPAWWKRRVEEEIRAQGVSQARLGKELGFRQGTLSMLLHAKEIGFSTLVRPVSERLGVVLPCTGYLSQRHSEAFARLQRLRPRYQGELYDLVRSMAEDPECVR